ncbi:TPA: anthranilate synthase component I, partial [Candidatus Bathyarchaeota archaeon]|nr:anthranilate synthase component I [Candidatus Bathyarchaeota archaeon]
MGFGPRFVVKVKDGKIAVEGELGKEVKVFKEDPLRALKAIVEGRYSVGPFRFAGGFVGYISYDAIRYWEKLPERAVDDLNFPDIEMGLFDDGVIFDHARRRAFYYYRGEDRLSKPGGKEPVLNRKLRFGKPRLNYGRKDYEKSVKKVKEYISSGDAFQVVLSKRYELKFEGDLARFYLALKKMNPSPYMYFLKMGKRQIVGSSPEMLVRLEGRSIETFPIAGTRPRGKDGREDRKLA